MSRPLSATSLGWLLRLLLLPAAALLIACMGGERAEAAPSCSASVTPLTGFGTIDGLNGGTFNATATLSFSCTGLTSLVPVTLCPNLDAGSGGTDGAGGRYLANGSDTVVFQIYQDAARTQSWGSSSFLAFGATPTITANPGTGSTISVTRTLYVKVVVPATAKPVTYSSAFANQNWFWGLNLVTCAGVTVGFSIPPASFSFEARIDPGCTVSGSTLGFGAVGVINAPKTAQNAIDVHCTNTTPYSIGLGNGLNGTSPTARKLAKGAERITYGIYKDQQGTQPWGDAALGAAFVRSGTGNGLTQSLPAYGIAPAQTTPSPGAYSDTVVATVTY